MVFFVEDLNHLKRSYRAFQYEICATRAGTKVIVLSIL